MKEMAIMDLDDKDISYLTAIVDMQEYVLLRRARGWYWDLIAEGIMGLGRSASKKIDKILEDIEKRAAVRNAFEEVLEEGYCAHCKGRCCVSS